MTIVEYKESKFSSSDLKCFFHNNDFLFPDPFSGHVDLDTYMDKLINNGRIFMAVDENEILGISCNYMNDYVELKAHLQMLLVAKNSQGKGVGRKLALWTIDTARDNGFKSIELTVDISNKKAVHLYNSIGFENSDISHSNPNKKYMICKLVGDDEVISTKQSQRRLLEMGKIIHTIFEKNNIPYMITFGTLLGAVRHKGFIPWDDDFDIFLFGDSYAKAIDVLRENLPKDMFLEDEHSEPLYFHSWAHVKDTHTYAKCDQFPQDNIYSHHGLSIDLYVMYEMKESDIDLFRLRENLKYQERKYRDNLLSKEEFVHVSDGIKQKIIEEINHPSITSGKRAYGMVLNERVMYPEEIFPLKKYIFEDTEFYGPNDYDSILKRFYGDYMKLPKVEDRIPHYSFVKRI